MFLKYFVLLVLWGTCVLGKNNLVILTSNTNEKNPLSITCLYDHQVTAGDIVKWNHTDVEGVTTKLESNSMSLNITSKSEAGEYSCIINGAVVSITTAAYVSQPFIQVCSLISFQSWDALIFALMLYMRCNVVFQNYLNAS